MVRYILVAHPKAMDAERTTYETIKRLAQHIESFDVKFALLHGSVAAGR